MSDLKDFGITLNHVFRYAVGGFVAFLVAAIVDPVWAKPTIDALGNVLSPLAAFAIGAVIYVFYRLIFGAFAVHWIIRRIHGLYDWIANQLWRPKPEITCKYRFLQADLGIHFSAAQNVFREVRDHLYREDRRRRFELEHSELHLVYVTFFASVVGFGFAFFHENSSVAWGLGVISGVALLFGVGGDIALNCRECLYIRTLDRPKTVRLLEQLQRQPSSEARDGTSEQGTELGVGQGVS